MASMTCPPGRGPRGCLAGQVVVPERVPCGRHCQPKLAGISDVASKGMLPPGGAWDQARAGVPMTARQVAKRSVLVSR